MGWIALGFRDPRRTEFCQVNPPRVAFPCGLSPPGALPPPDTQPRRPGARARQQRPQQALNNSQAFSWDHGSSWRYSRAFPAPFSARSVWPRLPRAPPQLAPGPAAAESGKPACNLRGWKRETIKNAAS
ncbi:hypothetical protein Nmel_011300 [Mimus melanotis]